jgi:hypothetical protein
MIGAKLEQFLRDVRAFQARAACNDDAGGFAAGMGIHDADAMSAGRCFS